MRKISIDSRHETISTIRQNVVEEILRQLSQGRDIDYSNNRYLDRIRAHPSIMREIAAVQNGYSQSQWIRLYARYLNQNLNIRNNPIAITYDILDQTFSGIANKIYDNCLFGASFWRAFPGENFTKEIYRDHFFDTNNCWVCPYCDMEIDRAASSFEIDHLLPSSKFPLLSIHENNLILACGLCNHHTFGKSDKYIPRYANYHTEAIGNRVEYVKCGDVYQIVANDPIAADHMKILLLNKRMCKSGFKRTFEVLEKKILKQIKTGEEFVDQEYEPFLYASRDIHRQFTLYDF